MQEVLHHPMFGVVVFYTLAVWPVWRIARRAGLDRRLRLIVLPSIVMPLLAPLLALMVLGHSKWPNLPPPPAPVPRKARRLA